MGIHRLLIERTTANTEPAALVGATLTIDGPEADHAVRAKRLRVGEPVELLDGAGLRAAAEITRAEKGRNAEIEVRVASAVREPPASPRVTVLAAPPKPDRLEWMLDQLTQAGAAAWHPLVTEHAERTGSHHSKGRLGKPERLERITAEAMKQCGRSHRLIIGEAVTFADALNAPNAVLVDATGTAPPPPGDVTLLIGPEAGFTETEFAQADAAGVPRIGLAPHVLRIETAAVLAVGRCSS